MWKISTSRRFKILDTHFSRSIIWRPHCFSTILDILGWGHNEIQGHALWCIWLQGYCGSNFSVETRLFKNKYWASLGTECDCLKKSVEYGISVQRENKQLPTPQFLRLQLEYENFGDRPEPWRELYGQLWKDTHERFNSSWVSYTSWVFYSEKYSGN